MFNWLRNLLSSTSPAASAVQAHLTFGATSVGRTISRTGLLLRKQLWIWPIIAVVLLASIGFGIRVAIERTMKQSLREQLETLQNVERAMLETWLKAQESNAESLANDQRVRDAAAQIVSLSRLTSTLGESTGPAKPNGAKGATLDEIQSRLTNDLSPGMAAHDFVSFILTDRQHNILTSSNIDILNQTIPEDHTFLSRALDGETVVSAPFPSIALMKDDRGRMRTGIPTMFVCAPVRDTNLQVIAVLGLRIRPEREFTRIVQLGRFGTSGETYAVNKNGLLVSNSRFDDELILLGLLPDTDDAHSILTISARDPGGDLTEGFRPKVRRSELPLTKSAASVVTGASGTNLDGYNDYRGVPSVAAWQWLPKYEMGLITKIDYAEAFRPLTILRWAFFSLLGLLTLSSAAIFVFSLVVARLHRDAQKAAIEAKQLGQYRLQERIGAGAMGIVYKGHHAMLRRPTAIKMLNVDKVNDASIQRFEREVQITCKLNHPSTVAIYDYGRTPEGVFYYAMEYLDGIDLQVLIDRYGAQTEGRVIHILKQICGSLYEAHSLGLVHRDVKPANVMLNRRGGEADVVKVLDFGLVRALDEAKQTRQTGGMTGTPLYMSPEAIQTPDLVDARSDLYAVGAIGYFLITGQPVFNASSLVELCRQHVTSLPDSPSDRLNKPVSPELESALLACLDKNRAKRPQTARDLMSLLDRAPTANSWSLEDAEAWWGRHERSSAAGSPEAAVANAETLQLPNATPASDSDGKSVRAKSDTNTGFDQTIAIDSRKNGR